MFTHSSGAHIRRPLFWDGGTTYRVRFASTEPEGTWRWRLPPPHHSTRSLLRRELWRRVPPEHTHIGRWPADSPPPTPRAEPGYADGTPASWSGDTAWAMPWRATVDEVAALRRRPAGQRLQRRAADERAARHARRAAPGTAQADEGFDVGFEDLPRRAPQPARTPRTSSTSTRSSTSCVEHGIVPVLQPVFFGFGWKGLDVAGPVVPPPNMPATAAIWWRGTAPDRPSTWSARTAPARAAGGRGRRGDPAPGTRTASRPGIHYRPHHRNGAHQDADWLDFQWCQTGHTR